MGFEAAAAVVGEDLFAAAAADTIAADAFVAAATDTFAVDAFAAAATDVAASGIAGEVITSSALGDAFTSSIFTAASDAEAAGGFTGALGSATTTVSGDAIAFGESAANSKPEIWGGFVTQGPMSVPGGTLVDGVLTQGPMSVPAGATVGGSVLPTAGGGMLTASEIAQGIKLGLDVYGGVQKIDAFGKPITSTSGQVTRTGAIPTPTLTGQTSAGQLNSGTASAGTSQQNSGGTNYNVIIGGVVALGLIWYFTKGQHHG